VHDLTSFQLNDTLYTSYGIDTPNTRPGWPAVLEYAGTDILEGATGEYSLLAWGCEGSSTPYYASYSSATVDTNTPAGIDIMSTSDKGPDVATLAALVKALKGLNNKEIQGLVGGLVKMNQDGARNGQPRVSVLLSSIGYKG
jgi:hypothetical protein